MSPYFTPAFQATIELIGVNPFVLLPDLVLEGIFAQAGRRKGAIPVQLTIDGHAFPQTLVKFSGQWRLYLNGPMRQAAGKQAGSTATFTVHFDPQPRELPLPAKLSQALAGNADAQAVFVRLPASRRLEIVRYISRLKSEASIDRNVEKAMRFLLGKERFIGRDHP